MVGEIAREWGGSDFQWATRPEERSRLWEARHTVYEACLAMRPGTSYIATDVCVPISRLADAVTQTKADIEETGLVAPIVGHVGDGNFHVSIMADTGNAEEMQRTGAFIDRLNNRAIAMDGTCTVGIENKIYEFCSWWKKILCHDKPRRARALVNSRIYFH